MQEWRAHCKVRHTRRRRKRRRTNDKEKEEEEEEAEEESKKGPKTDWRTRSKEVVCASFFFFLLLLSVVFRPKLHEDIVTLLPFLAETGPFSIPLKAFTKRADIALSSNLIDFGTVVVGEIVAKSLQIQNKGKEREWRTEKEAKRAAESVCLFDSISCLVFCLAEVFVWFMRCTCPYCGSSLLFLPRFYVANQSWSLCYISCLLLSSLFFGSGAVGVPFTIHVVDQPEPVAAEEDEEDEEDEEEDEEENEGEEGPTTTTTSTGEPQSSKEEAARREEKSRTNRLLLKIHTVFLFLLLLLLKPIRRRFGASSPSPLQVTTGWETKWRSSSSWDRREWDECRGDSAHENHHNRQSRGVPSPSSSFLETDPEDLRHFS